jgi:hypothetical protein
MISIGLSDGMFGYQVQLAYSFILLHIEKLSVIDTFS